MADGPNDPDEMDEDDIDNDRSLTDPSLEPSIIPNRKQYTYWSPESSSKVVAFVRQHGRHLNLMAKVAGVSYQTLNHYLKTDEDFKVAVEEAMELRAMELEDEARRRAIKGNVKKTYDRDGQLISKERVYSDKLMERLLEADNPKFKRDNPFKTGGAVGGVLLIPIVPKTDPSRSIDSLTDRLERLSENQRVIEENEGEITGG